MEMTCFFCVPVDRCNTEKQLLLKRASFNIVRDKQVQFSTKQSAISAKTNTKIESDCNCDCDAELCWKITTFDDLIPKKFKDS